MENEITPKEVMQEVQHLCRKMDDYAQANNKSHEELWKHVNKIREVIPGLATDIALLNAYKEQLEKNERMKGYREWGIVLLLVGLLIKAFFVTSA